MTLAVSLHRQTRLPVHTCPLRKTIAAIVETLPLVASYVTLTVLVGLQTLTRSRTRGIRVAATVLGVVPLAMHSVALKLHTHTHTHTVSPALLWELPQETQAEWQVTR